MKTSVNPVLTLRSLSPGDRVVCFYSEDDHVYIGFFEGMTKYDGEPYFYINSDMEGRRIFPQSGTRIYKVNPGFNQLKFENENTFVKLNDCVCINGKLWGYVREINFSKLSSRHTHDGILIFCGWSNGVLPEKRFIPFFEYSHISRFPYPHKTEDAVIQPSDIVVIDDGDYYGKIEAVFFPNSPLLKPLGFSKDGGFLLRIPESGDILPVSWGSYSKIRHHLFGQYTISGEHIQRGDKIVIKAPFYYVEGEVIDVVWEYSVQSLKRKTIHGGVLITETKKILYFPSINKLETKAFYPWNDFFWIEKKK